MFDESNGPVTYPLSSFTQCIPFFQGAKSASRQIQWPIPKLHAVTSNSTQILAFPYPPYFLPANSQNSLSLEK